MTEESVAPPTAPERTGIASLDAVLDQVAGLEEQPLAEHAAVFEAAHAALRRPLDNPADLAAQHD